MKKLIINSIGKRERQKNKKENRRKKENEKRNQDRRVAVRKKCR